MNHLKHPNPTRLAFAAPLLLALLLGACGGDKPEAMLASAKDYLAKNDPKAAVIQLKNALQANPDLPEARYVLGLALLRGGDPVGAETELRKAINLKHPVEQVAPPMARAMLALGQHKKLIDEFARVQPTTAVGKAELQTALFGAYSALGQADQARAALDAALAADPQYAPALMAQVRAKAVARDIDGALAQLDGLLTTAPANFDAWKLKGDILQGGKTLPTEAIAAYRKAVEVKADYVPAHTAILALLLQQGKFDEAAKQLEQLKKVAPNQPQTKYFEAAMAYQKNDLKAAREAIQQVLKAFPGSMQGLQLAGLIELRSNSLIQAEDYLAKVVQAMPESVVGRRVLAATYLRGGQPAKALATMQPLLKRDDLDATSNSILGQTFLQNGDTKKAEEYFAKASKQDPKNTRTRTSLALTHLAGGREDAAFAELQDIAASDTDTSADMALISAHLNRKEYDKALKAIDGLEKKQPDKPLAANLRGRTLLAKQDVAGARKSFERAVAIDPMYFPAVASLAGLDMADKKPEEARKRFEAVLAKDPKNGQALLALAEMRARSGGSKDEIAAVITRAVTANPTDTMPRLLLIELHLRNKEFKLALAAAQNAIAAVPDHPELLDALGRAQLAAGDTNQAFTTFNKVAALQPTSASPHMRLAEAYMFAKNPENAQRSLRKALEVQPDLLAAQAALVQIAMGAKNYPEALSIARTVQKQRPKSPAGYQLEGDVAANQKKFDLAADVYRTGLKVAPTSELARKVHAALGAGNKTADAEKFSAGWIKDNPKDVAFRLYLAETWLARGDLGNAEKSYLGILQVQPENAVVLNNLAWVTGKLKKDGAVAYAEKAIKLVPAQPTYMDTLAMLLSDKNDYAKALEWQTKALVLQPENSLFKFNLAKIHIQGGKKELARTELDALAKLGDKFGGQAEVAALLKTL